MKTNILITVVLFLIAGVLFYFYAPDSFKFWQTGTIVQNSPAAAITSVTANTSPKTIAAQHQFKDGTHTVFGQINLPSPCYTLSTKTTIAESFPEQVTIAFTSVFDDSKICAQVVTATQFKVDFMASENASIKAMWNGIPVTLSLTETRGDQEPDFEIFKG